MKVSVCEVFVRVSVCMGIMWFLPAGFCLGVGVVMANQMQFKHAVPRPPG